MTARSPQYDVIIAGAGPAGSCTAIRLADAGRSVLLLEQKQFPRQKLCGEFISPECLGHFAELGIADAIRTDAVPITRTVFYTSGGRSIAVPSEWFATGSHAIGLSWAEMDARLMQRARDVGVDVHENAHITSLSFSDGKVHGVRVRSWDSDATSRLVVDATGRARLLAREIEKAQGKSARRADYVAFKAHFKDASVNAADCEIYGYRGGYGGCSHVENGLANLCFIVTADIAKRHRGDAADIMQTILFKNERAASTLRNARLAGEWLAVPIESYGRGELAPAEGLLTVGDAAAFIDPFTGSGILLALESGKVVSGAIDAEWLQPFGSLATEYERRYRSAFDRRLRASSFVRLAAFVPFLAEIVVLTLSKSDGLARRLARATRPAEAAS